MMDVETMFYRALGPLRVTVARGNGRYRDHVDDAFWRAEAKRGGVLLGFGLDADKARAMRSMHHAITLTNQTVFVAIRVFRLLTTRSRYSGGSGRPKGTWFQQELIAATISGKGMTNEQRSIMSGLIGEAADLLERMGAIVVRKSNRARWYEVTLDLCSPLVLALMDHEM